MEISPDGMFAQTLEDLDSRSSLYKWITISATDATLWNEIRAIERLAATNQKSAKIAIGHQTTKNIPAFTVIASACESMGAGLIVLPTKKQKA